MIVFVPSLGPYPKFLRNDSSKGFFLKQGDKRKLLRRFMESSTNNINPSVIAIPLKQHVGSYGLEAPKF